MTDEHAPCASRTSAHRLQVAALILGAACLVGLTATVLAVRRSAARVALQADLVYWAGKGDRDRIAQLLAQGADPNTPYEMTPLEAAAVRGHAKALRLLLASGARAQSPSSALHYAAAADDAESIRLLISSGADVNARDASHLTAMMHAADVGAVLAVRVLIAMGADLSCRDTEGATALDRVTAEARRAWPYVSSESLVVSRLLRKASADASAGGRPSPAHNRRR